MMMICGSEAVAKRDEAGVYDGKMTRPGSPARAALGWMFGDRAFSKRDTETARVRRRL